MKKLLQILTFALVAWMATPAYAGEGLTFDDIEYEYDVLERLTKVNYVTTGYSIAYSYDAAGNRVQKVINNGSPPPPSNNAPVAVNDSVSATLFVALNIWVLTNDTDADGDTLTITAASSGSGFITTILGGGTHIEFEMVTSGTKTFTYTISDGNGGTDTATVTVTQSGGGGGGGLCAAKPWLCEE